MISQNTVSVGNTFTVQNPADYRFGWTFVIKGFSADKGGMRYAVCEWLEERGIKSSYIFYIYDVIS